MLSTKRLIFDFLIMLVRFNYLEDKILNDFPTSLPSLEHRGWSYTWNTSLWRDPDSSPSCRRRAPPWTPWSCRGQGQWMVRSDPRTRCSQPHWKTTVSTPTCLANLSASGSLATAVTIMGKHVAINIIQ